MGAIAHALFRRQSDDDIHQSFGNRPLDIGASFTYGPLWQISSCSLDSGTAWLHPFRWPGAQPT
jgi:hypothetical protein